MVVFLLQLLAIISTEPNPTGRPLLTTAIEVRALTPDRAGDAYPVVLTGVVTHKPNTPNTLFVQDDTAGIYVESNALPDGIRPGTRVRVTGTSARGWFSPVVTSATVQVLGVAPLPEPLPFNFSHNDARWLDAQFVQAYCLVREVRVVAGEAQLVIEGTAGPGFLVFEEPVPEKELRAWIGSVVRARGVCGPEFDLHGQLTGNLRLILQSQANLTMIEPAERVSVLPIRTTENLRRFIPGVSPIRLVKMAGIVTGQPPTKHTQHKDATGGFRAQLRPNTTETFSPGTRVEVLGFLTYNGDRIALRNAHVVTQGSAPIPDPREIHDEKAIVAADACRVRLRGRVTEVDEGRLLLATDVAAVSVRVPTDWRANVEVGSLVTVTGALTSKLDVSTGLILLPLSPDDLIVESSPDHPWITRVQAQVISVIGITALLAVAGWVISLRRAVRVRTHQIRESEQKFAAAFRSSPDAIVITRSADGGVLEVNDGFCQLTGFTHEQVIGRSTLELTWLDQADRNRMLEEMRRSGCVRDYPADMRDAAGHTHQVVISSTPMMVGGEQCLLSIVRDVTERHQAESAVRNEKLFTDTMIESMPGILYFYDAQGRFLRWNRNFETVSGYSAAEIARMRPLDFFSDQEKSLIAQRIAVVFETGAAFAEASFVAKDGTATPYYFTGRRVTFDDAPCLVGIGIDISERQKALLLLAESERKYRELVEHANSIILRWTPDGRITFLNEFGQRFFGYTAAEIIGCHVMDTIVPPRESTGRDLRNLMQQLCADPQAFEQNVNENVCRNGTHVWISWTNRVVFDPQGQVVEILSIGSDITARRRAEQALAASERKFATLFHMSPMVLALSSLDGVLRDVNQAFINLYGIPRDELIGHRSVDVPGLYAVREERAALVERLMRDGRIRNLERTHPRRDGSIITTVAAVELIELDGGMHILTAVVDVSQQKQAQEMLHESNIALERRVAERTSELETANQELEAFCYSVSHDLRAPLRAIDGFCQAVLEDYAALLDDTGKNYLVRVRAAALRMSELIDDLLTLSRITRSGMQRERVDLSALAAEVVADLRQHNPERSVSVAIAPRLIAQGDKNLLRVLLDNLIGNAWKYTGRTADPRIEFGREESPEGAVFYVRDNGAGFDPTYAHKLFLPFQRLHRADEFPGHGVGLATVQRIVRRHGGTVTADGSVGHGATFRFTVPSGTKDST